MSRYGFLFDQTRCIGCNACQVACKDKNNLEPGLLFRKASTIEMEVAGKKTWVHYSASCNHCTKAACVKVCPAGSMKVNPDGTVGQNLSACIGCGRCGKSCPYGVPQYSFKMHKMIKCDSCLDLRTQGKNPACVDACPTHCLSFVDLDAISPEEKTGLTNTLPFLPDPSITEPALLIRPKKGGVFVD